MSCPHGFTPSSVARLSLATAISEMRLRDCGFIGRHGLWSLDQPSATFMRVTPWDMEQERYDARTQQTQLVGYVVAAATLDHPKAFEGIDVVIDTVCAEVRLQLQDSPRNRREAPAIPYGSLSTKAPPGRRRKSGRHEPPPPVLEGVRLFWVGADGVREA